MEENITKCYKYAEEMLKSEENFIKSMLNELGMSDNLKAYMNKNRLYRYDKLFNNARYLAIATKNNEIALNDIELINTVCGIIRGYKGIELVDYVNKQIDKVNKALKSLN
jgi:nitric oxide synthase oxygenase domain/subunit